MDNLTENAPKEEKGPEPTQKTSSFLWRLVRFLFKWLGILLLISIFAPITLAILHYTAFIMYYSLIVGFNRALHFGIYMKGLAAAVEPPQELLKILYS